MKILHLLGSNSYSGAENVVCYIVNCFRNDSDIEMVYSSKDGPIKNSLLERGVEFLPLKKLNRASLKKAIKTFKPDIIHAHDVKASILASTFSKKVRVISHIHCNFKNTRFVFLKSFLFLLASKKIEKIYWVSKSSLDEYKYKTKLIDKSEVLYNVIDATSVSVKANLDTNSYDYDVAFVGRLTHQKNPQRLLKIIKECTLKKPSIKFAVIGTGDLKDEVLKLANELDILNNADFLGFLQNPYKILKSAKLSILTSRVEGTPMIALESLALGVPMVSTFVDGMCDLIKDDYNGYLIDTDSGFVDKIIEVVENSELQKRLSQGATETYYNFCKLDNYKNALIKGYKIKN